MDVRFSAQDENRWREKEEKLDVFEYVRWKGEERKQRKRRRILKRKRMGKRG